jgi:hypothetical protein
MSMKVLLPDQTVSRRPFTSVGLYEHDRSILSQMLADARAKLAEMDYGAITVTSFQPLEWQVDGLKHRIILTDPIRLHTLQEICVVGFFGERHTDRDGSALEAANAEIVLEFRNYLGILSYSSMELGDGNWANLVLHDLPEAREHWRAGEAHAKAARELSPLFYRNVRIHNGTLAGGVLGGNDILIERTKYWDFRTARVWYAVRELHTPTHALAH